jgi:hypothetical protein
MLHGASAIDALAIDATTGLKQLNKLQFQDRRYSARVLQGFIWIFAA